MKILNIIGARPQIIKASAVSRIIKSKFSDCIEDIVVHTGQHYDQNMSSVFFDELNIPQPQYNLNIGSTSHGIQTAGMIKGIEEIVLIEKPDYVIVYGDTNSTLAASIASSKLRIPIVHIEAGLRSFNKLMPEEINRILCDHVSTFLFTPTEQGYKNLMQEGFKENKAPFTIDNPGVFHVGDIMYDNSLYFAKVADKRSSILNDNDLLSEEFVLATIHRDHNTDNPERLEAIFTSLIEIASTYKIKVLLPLHPRTKKILQNTFNSRINKEINREKLLLIIPPVSFLDMILLEKNAKLVMTDSGGVQKEAHFFQKPCIIIRPETEWIELVNNGTAVLADTNKEIIIKSFEKYYHSGKLQYPNFYGDGNAAESICKTILNI
ncbi:MAG: UDP-N-acetylglucosamine 2-epimerase (non-hydrolyzing) [Bacteroidales bacterium]|nr:UDP-N-acetylglucosamine 2-epimerase (non-hydrolyzing) [Bacteroidales bacterium]